MTVPSRRTSFCSPWTALLCPLLLLQPVLAAELPAQFFNDGKSHNLPATGVDDRYTSVVVAINSGLTLDNDRFNIQDLTLGNGTSSFGLLTLQNNAVVDVTTFRNINSPPDQASSLTITGGSSLTTTSTLSTANNEGTSLNLRISGRDSRLLARHLHTFRDGTTTISVTDHGLLDLSANRGDVHRAGTQARLNLAGARSRLTVSSQGRVIADQIQIQVGAVVNVSGAGSTLDLNESLRLQHTGTATFSDGAQLLVKQGTGSSGIAGISMDQNSKLVAGGEGTLIRFGPADTQPQNLDFHYIRFTSDNAMIYLGADAGNAPVAAARLVMPAGSRGVVFSTADTRPNTQKLVFNHTATADNPYEFTAGLEGHGTIENVAGSTRLSGSMLQFTGPINLTGGTLRLASDAPQSAIRTASNTTLVIEPELSLSDISIASGASLHLLGGHGEHHLSNLNLEAGSTLRLGLDSDSNRARVDVTQTARLGGAELILEKGSAPEIGRVYPLIQAQQLDGRFADELKVQNLQGQAEAFAFLEPTLSYIDANALSVSFARRPGEPLLPQPPEPDLPAPALPDPDAGQALPAPPPPEPPAPVPNPPQEPRAEVQPPALPPVIPEPVPALPQAPKPAPDAIPKDTGKRPDSRAPVLRFQDLAVTANQVAVATAIESQADNEPLHHFVLSLPASAPATTFDALSGDALSAIDQSLHGSANQAVTTVPLNRLQQQLIAARRPGAALASAGGQLPPSAMPHTPSNSMWLQPTGNWQRERSADGNPGIRAETGGLFLGGDHHFADTGWIAGLALGATQTNITVHERHARSTADNYSITLYGGKTFALGTGDLNTQFGLGYTRHHIRNERDLAYIGLLQKLASRYQAHTIQAFAEIGHTLAITESATIEPYVGIVVSRMHTPEFQENGGHAALRRAAQTDTVATTTLGLRAAQRFQAGAAAVQLHGSVGVRHATGSLNTRSRYSFDGGESFAIARRPVGQSSLALAAGIDVQPTAVTHVGLNYYGDFANRGRRQQSILAEMRWRF